MRLPPHRAVSLALTSPSLSIRTLYTRQFTRMLCGVASHPIFVDTEFGQSESVQERGTGGITASGQTS